MFVNRPPKSNLRMGPPPGSDVLCAAALSRNSSRAERRAAAVAAAREQEQKKADAEFARMLKLQADALSKEMQGWRAKAVVAGRDIAVRRCARKWLQATRAARFVGPFALPETTAQLRDIIELSDLQSTPAGAVAAFVLAVIRYRACKQGRFHLRETAQQQLAATTSPTHTARPTTRKAPLGC